MYSKGRYEIKKIRVQEVEVVNDEFYIELIQNIKDCGYSSFSDYFINELIYPHIYYFDKGFASPNLCAIDYLRLRQELLNLDSNNMANLAALAKEKKMTTTKLIANIVNKFLKIVEKQNEK